MIKYDSSWNRHHLCLILLLEFQDWKGCKFRARGAGGGNWYGAVISSAFCLVTSLKSCGWLRNPINHQKDETL